MATAATTPVDLADIREFLNITVTSDTGQDALITTLADGLTPVIEDYLGVKIVNYEYTETYDGDGTDTLYLRHYPIVSVSSLTDGTQSFSGSQYYLYEDEGYIVLDDDYFEKDHQNISITYEAGFGAAKANVPESIKLALLIWINHIWKKDNVAFSQNIGEPFIVNVVNEKIPRDVALILEPYRCKRFTGV